MRLLHLLSIYGYGTGLHVCDQGPRTIGGVEVRIICYEAMIVDGHYVTMKDPTSDPDLASRLERLGAAAASLCYAIPKCDVDWDTATIRPAVTETLWYPRVSESEMEMWGRYWRRMWVHELGHVAHCLKFRRELAAVRSDTCHHAFDAAGEAWARFKAREDEWDRREHAERSDWGVPASAGATRREER